MTFDRRLANTSLVQWFEVKITPSHSNLIKKDPAWNHGKYSKLPSSFCSYRSIISNAPTAHCIIWHPSALATNISWHVSCCCLKPFRDWMFMLRASQKRTYF